MTELMFEVVPPSRMTSEEYKEKISAKVAETVNSIKPDFINVPEVIDENFRGEPYYRNVSVRGFAKKLNELTERKIIVNKVVVHCNGMKELAEWLDKSVNELKIKNFVFVGGNSGKTHYPGPGVIQANKKAKTLFDARIGNIFIPSRKNEAQRLLKKTLSGADFFTSQLLFEAQKTKNVLLEYDALCKKKKVKPSKFFLSFAPVSSVNEIYFLRWLGVEIPIETEKIVFNSFNSIHVSEMIWREINSFSKEKNLSLSLGLNVEEIFLHNLEPASQLAASLKKTGI